jgi:hypothetical protein
VHPDIAAFNDLDILGTDAQNAYLNATAREKVYTICGPEFGPSCENQYAIYTICGPEFGPSCENQYAIII